MGERRDEHPVNRKDEKILYRPSDRRLLAKLVPNFVDRGCQVISDDFAVRLSVSGTHFC
jgi:hypothetical protein